jgi:hypothetical protein
MKDETATEEQQKMLDDAHQIEFVEPEEPVALAGSAARQMTGRSAGRVLGFGCD